MIAALRAMGWLRWRLLRNELRTAKGRDTWENLSRLGAVLTPILLALMLIPTALALVVGGAFGAWASVTHERSIPLSYIARGLLAFVMALIIMAPLMRSIQGSRINIERLRLLPISRRLLHISEVFSAFADPWIAVTAASLIAIVGGLVAAGAFVAAAITLIATLSMIGVLLLVTSVCTSAAMLLFRNRRRAELVTLVLVLALSTVGLLPLLMESAESGKARLDDAGEQSGAERAERRAERRAALGRVVDAAGWVPSEQYGKALMHGIDGEYGDASLQTAGLTIGACVLYLISSWAHTRVLDGAESSGKRRGSGPARLPRTRLPGWRSAASALGIVNLRTPLRTVRGKLAVYFTFLFVILLYLALSRAFPAEDIDRLGLPLGPLALLVGILLTQLSLQPLLANMFALDGAGLTLITLSPVSNREIVHGKMVACALLSAISWSLCLVGALLVEPSGSFWAWASVLLIGVASLLVTLPLCASVSALLPKTADLSKVGKAGNPHPTGGLICFLITAASLAIPAGLAALVFLVSQSWGATAIAAGAICAVGAVLYPLLARLPASLWEKRRENLLLVAGGR